MIAIGNFFFRYRNFLFIFLYGALFIPSPRIFTASNMGEHYYWWPISIGLFITVLGQVIRAVTIALAYIVRGGKDKKVYAEGLVTEGMFNHCRNPLYVGNILMLVGVGVLSNSLLYMAVFIPGFLFIYQAIVLAEEHFLRGKFGPGYDAYCQKVSRWWINPIGMNKSFEHIPFNWKRYVLKEHTTTFIWLAGIVLLLLGYYPELTGGDEHWRNTLLIILLSGLAVVYAGIRFLKKTGRLTE